MSFDSEHERILEQILQERLRGLPSARQRAPETLRRRLQEEFGASAPRPREEAPRTGRPAVGGSSAARIPWLWKWFVPSTALVAGILLGLALATGPHRFAGPRGEVPVTVQDYLRDVTHDGYLITQLSRPLELTSRDPQEASNWLDGGLPFTVALGHAPAGWQLQGARIWHTVSRLSALAEYSDEQGTKVLLFAVPAAEVDFTKAKKHDTRQGPVYEGQGWGFQGLAWRSGELAWSVVSTLPTAGLLDWLSAYRSHP